MPITEKGKEFAQSELQKRRANPPKKINNASLPAGSPMYFYCISCGAIADTKPEMYTTTPRKVCTECQAMKDLGWLE